MRSQYNEAVLGFVSVCGWVGGWRVLERERRRERGHADLCTCTDFNIQSYMFKNLCNFSRCSIRFAVVVK